jgi:hypothetical protein
MLPSVDKNVVALDIPASDRAQVHDRKLLKSKCQVTKAYLGHINFVRKYSPTKPYIWNYVFLYGSIYFLGGGAYAPESRIEFLYF